MKTSELISALFPHSQEELVIGDTTLSVIAEQFGTPLFVYDEGVLRNKWSELRSVFPLRFEIFYSVKANPNVNILRLFIKYGAGLEIASAGELLQAQVAQCKAERILFAGPGKTEAELKLAITTQIGEIHAESLRELEVISRLAQQIGQVVNIAIRVNPRDEAQGGAMRMGGKPAPFGIDEEALDSVLDFVLQRPELQLHGIHIFTGTQILDFKLLLAQYRKGLQIAKRVAERTLKPLRSLDFGGGLGIPYFENEQPLDLDSLKTGLEELVAEADVDPSFAGTRFVVEPGRFLVAESGVYLTRVTDVKISRGKTFVVVDGGMNHHLAASGNLGQTIKRNFPIIVANKYRQVTEAPCDVVGPLCTPLDTLGRSVSLPKVEPGDLLAILHSGAYARSASPLGFLSHPTPPEVLATSTGTHLIRRRGSPSDYTRDTEFLECHQLSIGSSAK